ncbi:hypothetical protein [Lachnobacterium bovis]|uniref:hypothetical protein n=1 Tax=Lachnobacterium bovis TaxID=140626 RepID=UPI00048C5EA0|nr:hypothetical protein [Lachnobacterium bovis]
MKTRLKGFIKKNSILLIFTCIVFIITYFVCANGCRVFAYFEYKDEVKKCTVKNHKVLSCDFNKLKVKKTKDGNYILIDDKKDRSFDLISKNEIGSYSYETQGKYFLKYPESFASQRSKIIKKYEYDIFNLDKNEVTKKIDLKALLNKYCADCFWTEDDFKKNIVVYSADGKPYITAGKVNSTNTGLYYAYDDDKNCVKENGVLSMHGYSDETANENYNTDNKYYWQVTYGGLYISLDQRDIIKSLFYYAENRRNIFQKVGSSNSKLNPNDVKYNFIYNKIDARNNPYENMKKYPNIWSYNDNSLKEEYSEDYYKNASIMDKISTANGVNLSVGTDYSNPFCKSKIEFYSSGLTPNMTNLFKKYPELKKYVGVKGKKITLFDHDLENDDQVLQLFTPDGKPLTFAGVKDDKVGEITGVADYCQKMKKYYETQKH